jgi:hypothetical protein
MLVLIERTSRGCGDKTPPVEGAVEILVTRYDYRVSGIENNPAAWENYSKSCTDIERMEDGGYRGKRRKKEKMWSIDIPDIYEFVKVHGDCIVSAPGDFVEEYPRVEIYDDYRE